MATPLVNSDFPHLPKNGTFTGDDILAMWNFVTGRTESVKVKDLAAFGNTTQNFEWVTPHPYLTDEVVTRGGNWYQALVNNNGVTPGTDPATWALITKSSSGLVMWVAGVFPQDEVFVLSDHKGYIDLYQLIDSTKPFVSSDIEVEELAEQWESIISPKVSKAATLASGTLELDFVNDRSKLFTATVAEAKDWSTLNDARAIEFEVLLNMSTIDIQTFPAAWKLSDPRMTGLDWGPLSVGRYIITGKKSGAEYWVTITQEPLN